MLCYTIRQARPPHLPGFGMRAIWKMSPEDDSWKSQNASWYEWTAANWMAANVNAGPPAHSKIATILLQETAKPGKRRLSRLIRSRNALLRLSGD
jgi:hypothetical protein